MNGLVIIFRGTTLLIYTGGLLRAEKESQEKGLVGLSGKEGSGLNSKPKSEFTEPVIWFSRLQALDLTVPIHPQGKAPHLSETQSAHLEAGNNSPESDNNKCFGAGCQKGAR